MTDERYRALPRGYGYEWSAANPRFCYACGWNLDLPDPLDDSDHGRPAFLQRLELLSRLPAARRSAWFKGAFRFCASYATGRGTWLFPRGFLMEKKDGYYVGGSYMGLEEGKRTPEALELESTFRMALVMKNMGRLDPASGS